MGEDDMGESVKGSYAYTDDNGEKISVEYTADENGFRPVCFNLIRDKMRSIVDYNIFPFIGWQTHPNDSASNCTYVGISSNSKTMGRSMGS